MMEALPGALSMIPGKAVFPLDIRAAEDSVRDAAADDVFAEIARICARRNVEHKLTELYRSTATPCHPGLMDAAEAAIKTQHVPTMRSEERRVGQECVSTCRVRWWAFYKKNKN